MPSVNDVLAAYINVRDKISTMEAAHKKELAPFKSALEKAEVWLLSKLQADNVESIKGTAGTAYKTKTTSVTLADRETFYSFAVENNQLELLDIRASKSAVVAYKEANKDIPPGVTWREELGVNVRRT